MWKRAIALLLSALLICTILPLSVYAANDPNSLTIDLTDYSEDISGQETIGGTDTTDFTIAAGKSKVFSYEYAKKSRVITLTPNAAKPVQKWDINGTEYSYTDSGGTSYYFQSDDKKVSITITATLLRFTFFNKASGHNWTIKPIETQSGFTATVEVADKTQGSAAKAEKETNKFELKATAESGYSFDYWLVKSDGSKITENPCEVTLTADEIYTAYFHTWKQATAASEPGGLTSGTDTDLVTATRKWDDTWTLQAKGEAKQDGEKYVFTYWSCDEDSSFKSEENPLNVTLTEDRHYVAHYLPPQIMGITGMSAGGGSWMAKQEEGSHPLIAGTSVTVAVEYDENVSDVNLPHSTIELYSGDEAAVKAGTATLLAKREGTGGGDRDTAFDGGRATINVDPWPEDVTKITAAAYTDGCDKHYCTLDVQTTYGAEGLPLTYLTTPRNCSTSASDPGPYNPDIYGATAVQNAGTGTMELYVAGIGGVYQYVGSSGTTDFVRVPGMEDLNTSGDNLALVSVALGVGGTSDDLTSLVKVYHALGGDQGGTAAYEVRWYSAEEGKWDHCRTPSRRTKYPSTNGAVNKVLILGSDEIWTQNAYYDGAEWTLLSGYGCSFDTFEKVNATTAYATATDGTVYKLNAVRSGVSDAWTQVDLGGKLLGSRYDGALAVKLTSGGYAILNADGSTAATYPEITKEIFGDTWTMNGVYKPGSYGESIVRTVGFGGDGKVYALVQGSGRNYRGSRGRLRVGR